MGRRLRYLLPTGAAVLFLISLPVFVFMVFLPRTREAAAVEEGAKARSAASRIMSACERYARGHEGRLPGDLESLVAAGRVDREDVDDVHAKARFTYRGAGVRLNQDPPVIVLESTRRFADLVVVGWSDGTAAYVPEPDKAKYPPS